MSIEKIVEFMVNAGKAKDSMSANPKPAEYWETMKNTLCNSNASSTLRNMLMNRDISNFNPRDIPASLRHPDFPGSVVINVSPSVSRPAPSAP